MGPSVGTEHTTPRREFFVLSIERIDPDARTLHALLDAANDGFLLVEAGVVVWANRSLALMYRPRERDALEGLPVASLFRDSGFGLPSEAGGRVVECALISARDDAIPVAVDATDSGTSGDRALSAFRVRDLRPTQTLEDEVLRTSRALHGTNREIAALRVRLVREADERDELLQVVSHELRTPVTVITGYNRLLLAEEVGPLTERQRHFLEESQKGCQRLNVFIGNLLQAAEKGTLVGPLEVREAPLEEAAASAIDAIRPLLRDRNLDVELRAAAILPRVRFDPPRIEQVLLNLLGNAAKFAPVGTAIEINISGSGSHVSGRAEWLEVTVSDAGPGVSSGDRGRIFAPYFQGEAGRRAGGLGLGLAICRQIVEAHGGEIHLDSAQGPGTRFRFTLPVLPDPPPEREVHR